MPLTVAAVIEAAAAAGLLDARAAQRAADARPADRRGDPVRAVARSSRVPTASLYHAVAAARSMPFLTAEALFAATPVVDRTPPALLRRRRFLPLVSDALGPAAALSDPDDREAAEAARAALGTVPRLALADAADLDAALDRALGVAAGTSATGDAVAFLDDVLDEALLRRASDVHLEPGADGFRIRLRIDGDLQVLRAGVAPEFAASLVSRVKVLAGLDIAETRAPQDGGLSRAPSEHAPVLDVRVATAPTRFGERATLRLLGTDAAPQRLDDLGLPSEGLAGLRSVLRRRDGLVLITGATGSGKSTTLYAALRELRDPRRNLLSVEDPIESVVHGVSQVQIDAGGKVTFARALRSLLRHDPDVLMIGEIRDPETLEIAMRAAMTGHLVLSTLHTRSACAAVARLRDLGAAPYQIASTLVGVLAQTLVRRLCTACRRERTATADEARALGAREGAAVHDAVGCPRCAGSGHRGRTAVAEFLALDADVRRLVAADRGEAEIAHAAGSAGMTALDRDAARRVLDGTVSPADGLLGGD